MENHSWDTSTWKTVAEWEAIAAAEAATHAVRVLRYRGLGCDLPGATQVGGTPGEDEVRGPCCTNSSFGKAAGQPQKRVPGGQ